LEITVKRKRQALKKIMSQCNFSKEVKAILDVIYRDDCILENLTFIFNGSELSRRALYIPEKGVSSMAMTLYNGRDIITNVNKIYEMIKHSSEPLFIEFGIHDLAKYHLIDVLQENPEVPYSAHELGYKKNADRLIKYLEFEYQVNLVRKEIDETIDSKDEAKFKELSVKLSSMLEKLNEIKYSLPV